MPSEDIGAFIFDFFGVIVQFDDMRVYRRLAPFCSEPDAALLAMEDFVSDPELIRGRVDMSGIQRRLADELGLDMPADAFERAWNEPYSWPTEGVQELINQLTGRFRLVLLSNVDAYYWKATCTGYEALRPFDDLLLSFEVGIAKPEPEAFRLACERAGCEPQRCYFIDDKLQNVEAARTLGLLAHHFRGVDALRDELEQRGVLR